MCVERRGGEGAQWCVNREGGDCGDGGECRGGEV